MNTSLVALQTLSRRETGRFLRIWVQTLLPPAITTVLYFTIFGRLIGPRIGDISGITYVQFIAPGLTMMAVINNSYVNVVSSFFSARLLRHLEELLISPMPNYVLMLGFVMGGVLRGVLVGILVLIISLFFTHLTINHIFITIATLILSATLFSLAGLTNAIFAKKFDDISIIPTFVLTPLTYFGGIFYSLDMLPDFWHRMSHFNPILYMVSTFRYGMLGVTDVNVTLSFIVIMLTTAALFFLNLFLLNRGIRIRS